jgi:hypothetical protein
MPTPLNAALICRIKEEVERVPSYSRTRLATASPHATGILCVSATAGGYSYRGGIVGCWYRFWRRDQVIRKQVILVV